MKQEKPFLNSTLIAISLVLMLALGCKKEEDINIQYQDSVTDVDGNEYKTVLIGSQIWMAENLNVTKYRDGSKIENITDNLEWKNTTTGACCDYKNATTNSTTYGKLYNFYAIADSRNICPVGWHIPTDDEWTELINSVGDKDNAGGKLKEEGTLHWNPNGINEGAVDSRGFTALPAGTRGDDGRFYDLNQMSVWYSSTVDPNNSVIVFATYSSYELISKCNSAKNLGFSVRCVKD